MPKIWGISGVTPKDWGLGKPPRWPFFFRVGLQDGLVCRISSHSEISVFTTKFRPYRIPSCRYWASWNQRAPLWRRKCLLDTVDGRNPANQLIGSLSHFVLVFIHLWRCRISSINSISIITFLSVTDLRALSRVWTVYRMSWTLNCIRVEYCLYFFFGGWIYWTTEWKARITTSIQ